MLTAGNDDEAIRLAQEHRGRKTVFVGILSMMMATGRGPLIRFVLDSVRQDPGLATQSFNGRSLLHLACGASCQPVVEQLLAAGADPNILDGGGHSPLYRLGGSKGPNAAAIVRALASAGADLDSAGGIQRSTALHEAARHGSLGVAEALVECGARTDLKDKKGLTPFDRAVNCKRHEVAEFLRNR
jgi:ankyrin repeat protein